MPRVTTYGLPQVAPNALPPVYQTDKSTAAEFGGARAKAIGGLGDAFGGVSKDRAELETDQTGAKEQANKYSVNLRLSEADPERSYFKLEGKEALDAYSDYLDGLKEEREGLAQELPNPRQREFFLAGTRPRFDRSVEEMSRHAMAQREAWIARASEERMNGAVEDAVDRYRDVGAINEALAIGRAEIVDRASREGWSPDATRLRLGAFQSRVHTGIVERRAGEDPLGART